MWIDPGLTRKQRVYEQATAIQTKKNIVIKDVKIVHRGVR